MPHRPPPPYLLGCALLFWGAMTGHPWIGLAMALVVEAPRRVQVRWDFNETAFAKAWQLSLLLAGTTTLLIWLDGNRFEALQTLITWFPLLLLPMQFVQAYGLRTTLPVSTFSYFARRRDQLHRQLGMPVRHVEVAFGHVLFVVALLSATLGRNANSPVFLPALAALTAWAMMAANRGRRVAIFLSLLVVSGLAVAGGLGLTQLYHWLDRGEWMRRDESEPPGHYKTSIGRLGELKQSGNIVWRLKTIQGPVPPLLHTSIYNVYDRGTWSFLGPPEVRGLNADFDDLRTLDRDGAAYFLASPKFDLAATDDTLPRFRLRGHASHNMALPVPVNFASLTGFDLDGAERNAVGTVRLYPKEAVVDGTVLSQPDTTPDNPPWRDPLPKPFVPDLKIPDAEQAAVRETCDQLGLRELPLDRQLAAIRSWFRREFRYTRYLSIPAVSPGREANRTALSTFLTRKREGHCEYFASAAALLLREAGVPARYAVGFAVMEHDFRRGESVIRGIHGHAWCRVWDENRQRWLDFDPTPPDWLGLESPRLSVWQGLSDAIQRAREDFYLWRNEPGNRTAGAWVIAAIGVLGAAIVARNLWRSRRRQADGEAGRPGGSIAGRRTPLHGLEKAARRQLGERPPAMPFGRWLIGLRDRLDRPEPLDEALALHHRLRFDPAEPHERTPAVARLEELTVQLRTALKQAKRRA